MTSVSAEPDNIDPGDIPSPADLHFGHFALVPEYRQVNRQLVQELFNHLPNPFVHVDLATGTGLVPQLLIEEAEKRGVKGTIVGIDLSAKALEIAEATTPHSDAIDLRFVQADARELDSLGDSVLPADGADSLSIHDAIHEITDEDEQRSVYRGMAAIAREGALLSSNSTFTTVSMAVANSLRGHGEWKLHFMRLTGARRNDKAGSLPYRRPDDYRQMIEDAGFEIVHELERAIHLTREALKAIARYPAFVEGVAGDLVFPKKLSLAEQSHLLGMAVDKVRYDGLPRIWHEIIGRKRTAT